MTLSAADELRIEALVVRMAEELRDRPSQEKEDRVGVEIAALPAAEREFVPTALLRLVAAERDGGDLPDAAAPPPPMRRRRWVNPLRFRRAYAEAQGTADAPSDASGSSAPVSPDPGPADQRDAPR